MPSAVGCLTRCSAAHDKAVGTAAEARSQQGAAFAWLAVDLPDRSLTNGDEVKKRWSRISRRVTTESSPEAAVVYLFLFRFWYFGCYKHKASSC